ncbi:hypothetical protein GCM10010218_59400 [Streptomyces mashuensis]|uniref:Uncharacterized protein n=1 Tax=Streptomyces mashuensis TaxID=33904 RepID=A0A919B863_9ACTN|nr:hypothetical protein GCM10010218_59400 [Streptomyces mashuensis]
MLLKHIRMTPGLALGRMSTGHFSKAISFPTGLETAAGPPRISSRIEFPAGIAFEFWNGRTGERASGGRMDGHGAAGRGGPLVGRDGAKQAQPRPLYLRIIAS